jgi:LPXTG-motif cell wall-anchored protein
MKMRSATALVAAVLWSTLAVAGSALASTSVAIGDNFYQPKTVTITAGESVLWTYASGDQVHTVTANDGSFDSSPNCPNNVDSCIHPGDSYSHTFNSAGSFDYHCKVHGFVMSGTVVVEAATTSPSPTGGSSAPSGTPTNLPNTGASPLTGPFVAFGLLFLVAGVVVLYRLRRRTEG